MEYHAMQILGVGENAPTTERDAPAASRPPHNDLIAKVIATTVIAKLTQGPQSMTPAMTAIAKRGANDLPKTNPVCEISVFGRRPRLRSFPLRFIFTAQCRQPERTASASRLERGIGAANSIRAKLYSPAVFAAIGRIDRPLGQAGSSLVLRR